MPLRRSARNADVVVAETLEALYEENTATDSLAEKPLNRPRHGTVGSAPLPALQKKLDAGKKTTAVPKAVRNEGLASKKMAAARKPAAPRKRKAPEPRTEPESLLGTVANAPDHPKTLDSTFTAPGLSAPESSVNSVESNIPTTPVSKKRPRRNKADTASPSKPVPFTPTPAGVRLIAGSGNASKQKKTEDHMLDDLASLNRNRPTAPAVSNAPVLTPNGSQVVVNASPSKRRKANEVPPDVGSRMKTSSTVETLLKDAEAFLISVDREVTGNSRLERLIASHQCNMFSPEGLREVVDPFTALASGIIGQQVSGAAAASIRKKFTALFQDTHPSFPTPAQVLAKDLPTLRSAGLSQRKAEYITGLAEKFASGEFTAEGLVSASDAELIEKLVAVRGLGRWSVEMFACFGLKRMDVFSTGDLGVQRGMAAYMGRDVSKLKNKGGKWKYMSEQDMLSIAGNFSPYRSLFMWYMWRIADVVTEVLE